MPLESTELICHFIDSILDDDAFASIPERIADFANTASVLIQTHANSLVQIDGAYGLSPDLLQKYEQYFWQRDVWKNIYEVRQFNFTVSSDDFITVSDFHETEIYRDLLRHEGDLSRCAGFISDLGDGERLIFGTHRTEAMGAFEPEVLDSLNRLADPLARMFQARRRLAAPRRSLAELVLDDQSDAILVVDSHGVPQFANACALRLMESANVISLRAGRISSPDPSIAASLRKLVTSTCKGHGGGDLRFPPPASGYRASVTPLPGAEAALACIRLRDEKAWATARANQAQSLHGLTAAETQLTEGLLGGLTPGDIANQRNVTMPTIRKQLRSIYAKTDVTGQAELLKLISGF